MNASFRAERRRPAPTHDEIVAFNQSRTPQRLSADQFDAQQGSLRWPTVLEVPEFAELRARLDKLFAERALHPYNAGQGSPNCQQIQHVTDEFRHRLQAMIHELTADEFIAGNKFLKSLTCEARFDSVSKPAEASKSAG